MKLCAHRGHQRAHELRLARARAAVHQHVDPALVDAAGDVQVAAQYRDVFRQVREVLQLQLRPGAAHDAAAKEIEQVVVLQRQLLGQSRKQIELLSELVAVPVVERQKGRARQLAAVVHRGTYSADRVTQALGQQLARGGAGQVARQIECIAELGLQALHDREVQDVALYRVQAQPLSEPRDVVRQDALRRQARTLAL